MKSKIDKIFEFLLKLHPVHAVIAYHLITSEKLGSEIIALSRLSPQPRPSWVTIIAELTGTSEAFQKIAFETARYDLSQEEGLEGVLEVML